VCSRSARQLEHALVAALALAGERLQGDPIESPRSLAASFFRCVAVRFVVVCVPVTTREEGRGGSLS